jgi:hypothetical protein
MRKTFLAISVSVVWLIGVGWTMKKIMDYKMTPGVQASASLSWPSKSDLQRKAGQATLLLFVHPRCPCTRATLSELARLMTSLQGRLSTWVVFIQPDSFSENWVKTDLWTEARRIPDVQTFIDKNGQEARIFGSSTSGQVLVYAPDGRLLFNGGITPSRGHEGDNLGVRRIISLVRTGRADQTQSAVFGCALHEGVLP